MVELLDDVIVGGTLRTANFGTIETITDHGAATTSRFDGVTNLGYVFVNDNTDAHSAPYDRPDRAASTPPPASIELNSTSDRTSSTELVIVDGGQICSGGPGDQTGPSQVTLNDSSNNGSSAMAVRQR